MLRIIARITKIRVTKDCTVMLKHLFYKGRSLKNLVRFEQIKHTCNGKMSWVSVKKVTGDERMQITFPYSPNVGHGKERVFNMDRLCTEELNKTLDRVRANVNKVTNKKKKKQKTQSSENTGACVDENKDDVCIKLLDPDGTDVEGSTQNTQAWQEGGSLVIGEKQVHIRINVPLVKQLILPKCIMAGFAIFPKVDAEFVDLEKSKFTWYKGELTSEAETGKTPSEGTPEWQMVHEGFDYVPNNSDINHKLKLSCTPSNGSQQGITMETVSKNEVTAGPGFCPFENRHDHTKTHAGPGSFRVMTYNILANTYADSDFSRDSLYPYCPTYALDREYRKQLLLKEISGYHGDILCLQEVDCSLFINDLLPVLETQGYGGALRLKGRQANEGTATFYRHDKFRLLSQHDIVITEVLKGEPQYKDIWDKISESAALAELVSERSTVLQVMVLQSTEDSTNTVVVGTTHLYFHPRASHVRIIQTIVCLRHLAAITDKLTTEGAPRPAVIFCGDLNSYPMGGVHQYIHDKTIPSNHADWYAGGKEQLADDMTFSHDLDLVSACGFPKYTNFVASFTGCLDYIYADKQQLQTVQVVPMPTHEEVTQYTALPNAVFPSDHIALVCDLHWS